MNNVRKNKKSSRKRVRNKPDENLNQLRDLLPKVILDRYTGLESENAWLETLAASHIDTVFPSNEQYIVSFKSPGNRSIYNVSTGTISNGEKDDITAPFDPTQIRVSYKEFPIEMILNRMRSGELELNPNFQRAAGIWDEEAQSRLIESLLIRIPIPVFYIDGSEDDEWIVVDGLQRLNTFKRFVLDKSLRLKGLEFLEDLHGKNFDELPRNLQRRILESTIGLYLIEKGTPQLVKLSIFQRINTGGLPLSKQEIRHALFQGPATDTLNAIVASEEFKAATGGGIDQERMADRECVLRCLAFMLSPYQEYKTKDMDGYLNDSMQLLKKCSENKLKDFEKRLRRAMRAAHEIFGREAFRKISNLKKELNPINRSLFEVWIVSLDKLSDDQLQKLKAGKKSLRRNFVSLLNEDTEFFNSITIGTGEVKKVQKRFDSIERLIRAAL